MSYTFSRRDFMKYTALAAAAVAVSGSLTGCSNPNQPVGVYSGSDVALSFGGTSGFFGIGGSSDKQVLKASNTAKTKTTHYSNGTLTCVFTHYPISEGTSCTVNNYQLRIVKSDGTVQYVNAGKSGITFNADNGSGSLKKGETVENVVTISGLNSVLSGVTVKEAYIQYFPRHNALGNENDAYSDVYASWNITSLFA